MTRNLHRYGWRPDLPDQRDLLLQPLLTPDTIRAVPTAASLRTLAAMQFPVYDQGALGSCTANAIAAAYQFALGRKRHGDDYTPSRLAIYYGERNAEGSIGTDSGAQIRDGMKVIAGVGAGHEALWPYDPARFAVCPDATYLADAALHRCTAYKRVLQTRHDISAAIAGERPVVFGISVYESFESSDTARTGTVLLPRGDETLLGGHAILAVGYDAHRVTFRNSWGTGWGDAGYGTLPWSYLTSQRLANDFWVVEVAK